MKNGSEEKQYQLIGVSYIAVVKPVVYPAFITFMSIWEFYCQLQLHCHV